MTIISYPKTMRLRRGAFAALSACALILAVLQGAHAENATSDYVAPLDLDSTYAAAFEFPDFLPDALDVRATASGETTGVSSMPPTERKEAAASRQEIKTGPDMSDDKYNR
jgi:hypothetical protein